MAPVRAWASTPQFWRAPLSLSRIGAARGRPDRIGHHDSISGSPAGLAASGEIVPRTNEKEKENEHATNLETRHDTAANKQTDRRNREARLDTKKREGCGRARVCRARCCCPHTVFRGQALLFIRVTLFPSVCVFFVSAFCSPPRWGTVLAWSPG